ncbi:IPK2 [Scenedesmus sp. PABB004]|nr:IPK2 [Scenedesmus sp. PABB004]
MRSLASTPSRHPKLGQSNSGQLRRGMEAARGLLARVRARAAPAAPAQRQQAGGPSHLIVLVNGLFGGPANWDVTCDALRRELPAAVLLHPSAVNTRFATYDGIDVCGARLADEVRGVVAAHPSLTRLSIVAHSMGGLIARHALGALYNPGLGTVCGLAPAHFVSIASPHLGCDADGVAQVPFVGWTGGLPLLGGPLYRLLADIAGPTASLIFRATGRQFFMLDGTTTTTRGGADAGTARLPLLLQLTMDCPDRGLYFYSALTSFESRTCYANTDGDHLVGWANSSLRALAELPPLPPTASAAKGVVLEDPLAAAFFPHTWRALQAAWQQQQQQQDGEKGSLAAAAAAAISQPCQPSTAWRQAPQHSGAGWHELQNGRGGAAASAQPAATPAESGDELVALAPARGGPADADADGAAPADAVPAAAAAAAEQDLAAGLGGRGTPAAARGDADGRAALLARMLSRLQELPWRRVDVSFSGARWGLPHNNIQVTRRWLNFEGAAVPAHVARELALLEALAAPAAPAAAAAGESLEAAALQPYAHQVGGHGETDGLPSTLADGAGRFLKKLQAGERGRREAAFYAAVEQQRTAPAASCGGGLLQQLAAWVPRSYGVRCVGGADYLVLDDVAAGYAQPCLLDVKLGLRTWYPWASDELQRKCRRKDGSTTQAALGFRVCGGLSHNSVTGATWRVDRHWGKQLTPASVQQAFLHFADNGRLSLAQLVHGPGMLLEQLRGLADALAAQPGWHLFSSSALLIYDGAAATPAEARPRAWLIDFAHAFAPAPHGPAPPTRDDNVLAGLAGLAAALEQAAGDAMAPLVARTSVRAAPFSTGAARTTRAVSVVCSARKPEQAPSSRREFMLNGVNVAVLGSLFTWGAVPRPDTLGVQSYGAVKTLGLCPPTPNCISTAEELNDPEHYVPAWTYNPEDGRGRKGPITQEQAMDELAEVVASIKPDKFEPKVVSRSKDYLYAEFQSPTFGFIDDVEFYFPPGDRSVVEYRRCRRGSPRQTPPSARTCARACSRPAAAHTARRRRSTSASRIGESDGNINRKRIKAIRQALEKKGWATTGY